jgi:hypothetical protein
LAHAGSRHEGSHRRSGPQWTDGNMTGTATHHTTAGGHQFQRAVGGRDNTELS